MMIKSFFVIKFGINEIIIVLCIKKYNIYIFVEYLECFKNFI